MPSLSVLEISCGAAAGYAGLLLAQLGHDVSRLAVDEPTQRPATPTEAAARNAFLHQHKRSLEALPRLDGFDVVVEDVGRRCLRRLGTSYRALRKAHPNLVMVSLSPFGRSGPYRNWRAVDLNAQAVGGVMHVAGYDGEAPLRLPGDIAATIAGIHGATAAATAALGVQRGVESAPHIDISAQDTLMQHWTRHVSQYAYSGTLMRREARQPRGIHARHTARSRDGWVYMLALRVPWQRVAKFLGLERYVTDAYADADQATQPWDEMEADFLEAVAGKNRYAWFDEAAALGWTFAPVETPASVMAGPQNAARGLFQQVTVTADGHETDIPVAGLPYRINRTAAANTDGEDRPTARNLV